MVKSNNKITNFTVGLAIAIGIAASNYIESNLTVPFAVNIVVTFLLSATVVHSSIFWILNKLINHSDTLLKFYWGKTYLKGYWSYTYTIDGVTKYGAWCIDQNTDSISIKGFGITDKGERRSDVQSLTSLIPSGKGYEVNRRRDISDDGVLPDFFYYSKTVIHLQQRNTFMNLFNYPLDMDGQTYIYGGELSGNVHKELKFAKHIEVKDEKGIEAIVVALISKSKK